MLKTVLYLPLGLVGLLGDSVATLVNVPATNLEISQTHLFQKKNISMYWESELHKIICTYVIILRNSRYNIRLCVHKIDYFAILLSKIAFTMWPKSLFGERSNLFQIKFAVKKHIYSLWNKLPWQQEKWTREEGMIWSKDWPTKLKMFAQYSDLILDKDPS